MKLKNLFGMAAMAALVLSGCSNDEVVENFSQDNAIEFGTYVGRDAQSRGVVLDNDGLKEQGFGVFAYYTGQTDWDEYATKEANFMNNTKVTYDANKEAWTYSPLKYWPNNVGDKVSFFAYAPYEKTKKETGSSITYTVPVNVKEHIDLVWNNAATQNMKKQDVDQRVLFVFQHALSKIGFTISAATDELIKDENKLDEATSIVVNRVMLTGTPVEFNDANEGDAKYVTSSIFTKTATLDLNSKEAEKASWTEKQGDQYYTLTTENFMNNLINATNSLTEQQLNADDSYLMIIPQDFTDSNFNVFIEYVVTTKGRNENGDDDCSVITNRINTPISGLNFLSSKQYTLNLILGMTSVKVEAVVNDWLDSDPINVDVPQNNPNNYSNN